MKTKKDRNGKLALPMAGGSKWEAIGRGYATVLMEKQARIDRLGQMIFMVQQNVCFGVEAMMLDEGDDLYMSFCMEIINKFKQLKGENER